MSNQVEEQLVAEALWTAENEAALLEAAQFIQYVSGTCAQARLTSKFCRRRDYLRSLKPPTKGT